MGRESEITKSDRKATEENVEEFKAAPSQGFKPFVEAKPKPAKLAVKRVGSLGREGGGRPLDNGNTIERYL